MFNKRDIVAHNIKILSDREVSIINNDDEDDYIFSALTVEGGITSKKGISVGYQDKMVPGLMIYDSENFYGFSEKYGLSLLSNHNEYFELTIPESIFLNKEDRTLQPIAKNTSEHFQNLKDTIKNEVKNLNIDLQIKDCKNFYITIPDSYSECKFTLNFNINYIYDLNSIISNLTLIFINQSNKHVEFKITNNNCYYNKKFMNIIDENSLYKINMEVINNNYFIIKTESYIKK